MSERKDNANANEKEETMTKEKLLKAASLGPLGDQARGMPLDELHIRIVDQAERHGVHAPAWPVFVDLVREAPYLRFDEKTLTIDFVHPDPKRDAAEDLYEALKALYKEGNGSKQDRYPYDLARAALAKADRK